MSDTANTEIETLEARIAACLTKPGGSTFAIVSLIEEAHIAGAAAAALKDEYARRALDPSETEAAAGRARAIAADAEFRVQRLRTASAQLNKALDQALEATRIAEAQQAEAARIAEEKAAIEQWNREYPILANRIAGLAARLAAAGHRPPKIILGSTVNHYGFDQYFWPSSDRVAEQPAGFAPTHEGDLLIKSGG